MIPYYPANSARTNASEKQPVEPFNPELAARPSQGHKLWMEVGDRTTSPQFQFGAWWEMDGTLWKVSWIEKTGELFATDLKTPDRFLILGQFTTRKEIRQAMGGWFGGNSLTGLINRLDHLAQDRARSSPA